MLNIIITPPLLAGDETWVDTNIVISENSDLSLPMVDVIENNLTNDTEFTYPIEVVNGKTYYAQARYTLEPGGLQGKSVITSFVADNSVEFRVELQLPIDLGKISITTDFVDNTIDHPHMFANFTIEPENDLDIVSTTWVLEDAVTHNVHFVSVNDTVNIHTIHLNRFLNPDTLYTIRAAVTTRAGITSVFTAHSFTTAPIKDPFMLINGSGVGWFAALNELSVTAPKPYDKLEVELYDDSEKLVNFFSEFSPVELDKRGEFKMARVRAHYHDGTISTWRYAYSIIPDTGGGDNNAYVYTYPFNYPTKTDYAYIYVYPWPYGYGDSADRCSPY